MMHTIDMHCDTLMKAVMDNRLDLSKADVYETDGHLDIKRLKKAGAMAQFFACFMVPKGFYTDYLHIDPIDDWDYINACHQVFTQSIERHSDIIAPATTAKEIRKNFAEGKVSGVFTIEDSMAVMGKMENIKRLYDMGTRAMSLTWNFENCFGFPNSKDPEIMSKGLTDFGKEAIQYMQELGILVDCSHLSDGGFYDVAEICKKPFICSHSNARSLCGHQRNLTDDMLKILGNAGGVSGINFCPQFLNPDMESPQSKAEIMAKMARHMADVGGMGVVGIGTDFDGIDGELEVSGPDKFDILVSALNKEGFSDDEIDLIANGNVLRVMDEAVK